MPRGLLPRSRQRSSTAPRASSALELPADWRPISLPEIGSSVRECAPRTNAIRPTSDGRVGCSMSLPGAVHAEIAGVNALIEHASEKRRLHDHMGAVAVDMESHIAGRIASVHKIPFAICRTIIDAAHRDLPPAALVGLRHDGTPDVLAVSRSVARQPASSRRSRAPQWMHGSLGKPCAAADACSVRGLAAHISRAGVRHDGQGKCVGGAAPALREVLNAGRLPVERQSAAGSGVIAVQSGMTSTASPGLRPSEPSATAPFPVTKPHGGVGIVFQSAMLLPWRSVLGNVMMPVEVEESAPQHLRGAGSRAAANGRTCRFRAKISLAIVRRDATAGGDLPGTRSRSKEAFTRRCAQGVEKHLLRAGVRRARRGNLHSSADEILDAVEFAFRPDPIDEGDVDRLAIEIA